MLARRTIAAFARNSKKYPLKQRQVTPVTDTTSASLNELLPR